MKAQVQRAQNLLNRKTPKPIEALAVFKAPDESGTPPWPVYHFAGIAYALLGDHTRCEEAMRAALDGGSAEPETYHTLSVALYKQEKYAEAESFARQVVQMKPDFVKALLNLGLILQAQARLEDALQIYAVPTSWTRVMPSSPLKSGLSIKIWGILPRRWSCSILP